MQIDRITEWDMTPKIESDITTLLAACFPTDFGGRSYFQQRHHVRLLAHDGDQLIGHMALCLRDVRLGETMIQIWGLADVATAPAARGRGVATALLTAAINFASRSPAAFLVLFGDRPLYAAHGFVSQPNFTTSVTLDGGVTGAVKTAQDSGLMVLPLSDQAWDETAQLDLLGHKF